jgi:serine/threonine protein kinase
MAVRIESHAEPIPGYRLIERLGGGGFGEVWKAEAPGGLFKAIKFVYGELDSAGGDSERAEQELKAIKRVQSVRHPYILSLERYDIIDGQLIIVMELADKNLWDRFKECRADGLTGIPRDELLGYLAETAEALDLMNGTYQLQHLDIKPQNLFLVHNHVKVADFGLVKDLEGMAASVTGGVTPVYAAPETFDGWVSRFSDQYSLAIVYQELLTGVRPFAGNNVRQLVLQHLQSAPNLAPLPPADQPIIARALSKDPTQRHPTCLEMVRALAHGTTPTPAAEGVPPETGLLVPGGMDTPQETRPPDAVPEGPAHTPQRPLNTPRTPIAPLSAPATPAAGGHTSRRLTRWVGGQRAGPTAPLPPPSSRPPSSALAGEGTLFPALVVGVGGTGLAVLRRLRQSLNTLVPGNCELGHLRFLYVDTDPDATRSATRGRADTCLGAAEVLLARLNRPSHYLKPRDGRPVIDAWFDPKMLYRIPRSQTTAGCRALGRLAFCDNYRLIAGRLRAELEACLDPEPIQAAAKQTRLGLRTARPRVYVVASLAGGSGGGMFLDLAYVTRAALRDLGQADTEVVGVFLLPPAERGANNPLPLGNACAALAELGHFCKGGEFSARYVERDNLRDAAPPFARCVLLSSPAGSGRWTVDGGVPSSPPTADEAAEFLARDLCTGLGQAADRARAALTLPAGASCQTFGLYKLAFPRRDLVARSARRLCRTLVERWMTKDGAPVREAVQGWVGEHWSREEYGPEGFIERLQEGCERALGQPPDRLFAQLVEPVSGRAAQDPTALADVLARLEEQVGRPGETSVADQPPRLQELLRDVSNKVVDDWGGKLEGLIVRLIESPEFRLAGAEEAIRHVVAALQKMLEHHEPLTRELTTRADDAHGRIRTLIGRLGQPGGGKSRQLPGPSEVQELLRCFAKWRYQGLVLQQVTRGLVSLRGLLSDELREVNYCRTRLAELGRAFAEVPGEPADRGAALPGRTLFPGGCATLDAAAEQIFQGVSAERLAALDERVQGMIREQFTALVHVCLAPANMLGNLEVAMQQKAEAEVQTGLSSLNAAELFFAEHADEEAAAGAISQAFAEAAPEMASRGGEVCVVVVPPGPDGVRFRDLARRALPEVPLVAVTGGDDVLFYREAANVPFADLEQLGPVAREAYSQLASRQHFTPHSRADIVFTVAGG